MKPAGTPNSAKTLGNTRGVSEKSSQQTRISSSVCKTALEYAGLKIVTPDGAGTKKMSDIADTLALLQTLKTKGEGISFEQGERIVSVWSTSSADEAGIIEAAVKKTSNESSRIFERYKDLAIIRELPSIARLPNKTSAGALPPVIRQTWLGRDAEDTEIEINISDHKGQKTLKIEGHKRWISAGSARIEIKNRGRCLEVVIDWRPHYLFGVPAKQIREAYNNETIAESPGKMPIGFIAPEDWSAAWKKVASCLVLPEMETFRAVFSSQEHDLLSLVNSSGERIYNEALESVGRFGGENISFIDYLASELDDHVPGLERKGDKEYWRSIALDVLSLVVETAKEFSGKTEEGYLLFDLERRITQDLRAAALSAVNERKALLDGIWKKYASERNVYLLALELGDVQARYDLIESSRKPFGNENIYKFFSDFRKCGESGYDRIDERGFKEGFRGEEYDLVLWSMVKIACSEMELHEYLARWFLHYCLNLDRPLDAAAVKSAAQETIKAEIKEKDGGREYLKKRIKEIESRTGRKVQSQKPLGIHQWTWRRAFALALNEFPGIDAAVKMLEEPKKIKVRVAFAELMQRGCAGEKDLKGILRSGSGVQFLELIKRNRI